jgi:Domain of unknown function (DUF4123)
MAEKVGAYLFAEPEASVYAVLDGASINGLVERMQLYKPVSECLYRGELAPDMQQVAPYLVQLDARSAFCDWMLDSGWGNHWGIFAVSRADFRAMRRHFQGFLTVHDPAGKPLLFRYYDPRVLRVYLPTCNPQELKTVFGPVLCYIAEGEDPNELLRFQVADGMLALNRKH